MWTDVNLCLSDFQSLSLFVVPHSLGELKLKVSDLLVWGQDRRDQGWRD
jgi:hypothetical protein